MLGENRRLDPMTGRAYGDGSITPVLPDVIPRPLRGNRQAKARRCFVQDSGVLQRTCVHRTIDSIFIEPLTPYGEPPNGGEPPNSLSDFVTPMGRANAPRWPFRQALLGRARGCLSSW
jgi:hypothetical protein